jgi:hypothetical protein
MRFRRFLAPSLAVLLVAVPAAQTAPQTAPQGGLESIQQQELREWLGYIASDELEGRQLYTEGLGLAAAYIADHLAAWGVKPAGGDGSYFQTVKVLGVDSTSHASVTVEAGGRRRTFKDGEGVSFARNMGGRQTITADDIRFVGYGLSLPSAGMDDYGSENVTGKVVVWLGPQGPSNAPAGLRRLLSARGRMATGHGAAAVIGPAVGRGQGAMSRSQAGAAGSGPGSPRASFTTTQDFERPVPPVVTADEAFLEFLFSGSGTSYAELQEKAARREPLPHFTLERTRITIDVSAEYEIVNTRRTRNVVGLVEGSDPALKDTYVLFGAHYDHIGYSQTPPPAPGGFTGAAPGGCTGQTRDTPAPGDVINNGADDDGSGTVALMAIARAFARGPKPKRSVLFVWHAGEEAGLLGSRYMADHPVVPLDRVAAQLNVDMIGRNRCDDPSEGNTVYLVGSDRISTELHNLSEAANRSLPAPLDLDYELNDAADPESLYTRSDHYSYASKGIPVIFYTTGLHRDYHYLTDEIGKIEFPKMTRIAQLIYETGWTVANLDHFPVHDNRGPRMGKGSHGPIASER